MGGRTSLTLAEGMTGMAEGGPAKGGMATLFINGEKVGEERIPATQPGIFSADETADVGIDLGTPVVEAIGAEAKSRFTGRIPKVTVDVR
jgi:arylsulfatase